LDNYFFRNIISAKYIISSQISIVTNHASSKLILVPNQFANNLEKYPIIRIAGTYHHLGLMFSSLNCITSRESGKGLFNSFPCFGGVFF